MMFKKDKNPKKNNLSEKSAGEFAIVRLFRYIGRAVDWIFSYNLTLIVVSIISAGLLYLYVVGIPDQLDLTNFDTKTLEEVQVEVINDDNAKVIEVYDEDGIRVDEDEVIVDVIIKGPRNEVLKVVNDSDIRFFVDTGSIKDGETRDMNIVADNIPDSVTVTTSPSFVRVEANKKITSNDYLLVAEAVNINQLGDNLTIESITLNTNEVLVSGSEKNVNNVVSVKALVDVGTIKNAGEVTLGEESIKYKAYDNSGEVVDVEISVKDQGATVVISDYSREVPVVYNFEGETPEGKSIGEIETSVQAVRVFGEKEVIDSIEEVPVVISLADFSSNETVKVQIPNPDGVISMSEKSSSVTIVYEDTDTKTFENISVSSVNLDEGFTVQPTQSGQLALKVEIAGAPSVIDKINAEDIILEVDLSGLGVGTHLVEVYVKSSDSRVEYILDKKNVELEIKEDTNDS